MPARAGEVSDEVLLAWNFPVQVGTVRVGSAGVRQSVSVGVLQIAPTGALRLRTIEGTISIMLSADTRRDLAAALLKDPADAKGLLLDESLEDAREPFKGGRS